MKVTLVTTLLLCVLCIAACSGPAPTPATSNPTNLPAPTQASAQPTNAPAPTQSPAQPTIAPAPTQPAAQPTTESLPTVAPTAATSAPSGSGNVQPPAGSPVDIVKKASLSAFDANTVRAQTLIEGAGGDTSTLTLEYIKPDRVHIVQSTPQGAAERIAIRGKNMWLKSGDKWQAQGADAAALFFSFLDPKALAQSLDVIQSDSVQFVGAEVLDNVPTFVYTYKIVVDYGGQKSGGDGKIWIGAADGRAYKVQSVNDSLTTPGKQDRTTALYDYDLPLTIEEPQ